MSSISLQISSAPSILSAIVYPDGTEVTYEYDVNNNLVSVTDWEARKTVYTYDENNKVIGVIKPDGSATTTVYDNAGRVTSSVERNAMDVLIAGFEYTYDILGRVTTEKHLDKNLEICYTYDRLSRVTLRTVTDLTTCNTSEETFNYDSAGNILNSATNCDYSAYTYDGNNRLTSYNGTDVTYDADGNMTSAYLDCTGELFRYDSTNRLVGTNTNAYTYNAENVRIRNLCGESETTYVYDTNAKLSRLLVKTTDGRVTKYVYGRGLIGEEINGAFKTYHFDYRGSTVAITDINGNITDRFEYDTYGKLTGRTGTSDIIFLYNGRDGVVTDGNGLIYMRARYYAPELRRFINADILAGDIANGITLNRYAYANANPVSLIDPKGLSAERGVIPTTLEAAYLADHIYEAQRSDIGKPLAEKFGGWMLVDILTNNESLKIGVYAKTVDGVVSYAYVNKGSSLEWSDWINNFQQPFGWSTDMEDSIKYAENFVEEHPNSTITFIGHSKGGAEAAANAVATNRPAILFNPATVALDAYGLNDETYSADMTAYVVKGEILNNIFGGISVPIGKMEYLPTQYESKWYSGIIDRTINSIKNHQMDAVISALGGQN